MRTNTGDRVSLIGGEECIAKLSFGKYAIIGVVIDNQPAAVHGLTFKVIFGSKGVGGTEGNLVADEDELGCHIEEQGPPAILLERGLKTLRGAQAPTDTGLVLVYKDGVARVKNIAGEGVLLPHNRMCRTTGVA